MVITNPKAHGFYGSQVAVPVFRTISDRLYSTSPSLRRKLAKEKVQEKLRLKSGANDDVKLVSKKLALPLAANSSEEFWVNANYDQKLVSTTTKKTGKGVPNVKSLSLKDALFLLENAGLKVVVKGKGKVVKQSLRPGEKIIRGKVIELILA